MLRIQLPETLPGISCASAFRTLTATPRPQCMLFRRCRGVKPTLRH